MSAAELARKLAVPTNRITGILNGQRAVTGDTPYASPITLARVRSSGSTCKAFTNCAWPRKRLGNR